MGWIKTEKTNTLAKLGDINFSTSPVDGNALVYDGTNQVWKPGQGGGGGASALSDLADVDISGTIQGGKVLKYNAVEEKWVPGDDSGSVQSDWNENDPTSGAFILNKPNISNIISGTANPSVDIGNNGDIYLKKELTVTQEQMDINYLHTYDGRTTTITISQNDTVIYTNTVNNVQQGDLDGRYAGFDEVTANVTSLGGIPFIFKYRGVAVNDNYPLCFFTSFNDGEETGWRMDGSNSSFSHNVTKSFNVPSGFSVSEIFLKDNDEWIVYKQDQIQADWNESDTTSEAYILNKPTIPAAQINSDWYETDSSSKAYIFNKPTIPDELSDLSDIDLTNLQDGQFLQYNEKKQKWVNSTTNVPFEYFMYATLTAGQTSLSFTSPLIGANTFVDIYVKDSNGAALLDILPTAASVSGTTITLTFEARSSDIDVALKLSGEPGIVYDYSLSNITLTKNSHYNVDDIPEFSTNETWELVFDYDFTGDPMTYENGRFAFFTLGDPEVIGALYGFAQGGNVWGRIQYNNTYTSFFSDVTPSTLVGKHIFKYRFENHILYLYLDDNLVNSYNITSDTTFNNILIGSGSTTSAFFTDNGFDGKVNFLGFRWLS